MSARLLQVRGFYVKTGQVMAAKKDFIPQPWIRRLSVLWDDSPPRPWPNVRASMLQDLAACSAARQLGHTSHADATPHIANAPAGSARATVDLTAATQQGGGSDYGVLRWSRPVAACSLAAHHSSPSNLTVMRPASLADLLLPACARPWRQGPAAANTTGAVAGAGIPLLQGDLDSRPLSTPKAAPTRMSRRVASSPEAKLSRYFEYVDPRPLASASIAQVRERGGATDVSAVQLSS